MNEGQVQWFVARTPMIFEDLPAQNEQKDTWKSVSNESRYLTYHHDG